MPANAGIQVDFRREYRNSLYSSMRRNDGNRNRLAVNDFKTLCLRAKGSLVKVIGFAIFAAVAFLVAPHAHAQELNILFKTTPAIEHLRPYADPAMMSLLVTGGDGRPVTQGTVMIRLDAPKPGRFFSTDFPWVEGTRLHEMRLALRQGRANWKYLFPIRGEYRLAVDVETVDGKKSSKQFLFNVRENEKKWVNLAAFSAALFFLGLVAGRIFTGVGVKATVVLAAALLTATSGLTASEQIQDNDGAALEVEIPMVGQASAVRWHLKGNATADAPALLSVKITHLEKEKTAFEIERVPVAGEFAMKFQFTDGAEYRVVAVGEQAGKPPLRSEKVISATALEPPAKAMIPAFAYFLGVIALGLGAGRLSKRRSATS